MTGKPTARIVVGVDGSAPSRRALARAGRLAAASGAGVDAVISWEPPIVFGRWLLPESGDDRRLVAEMRHFLSEVVDDVFGTDRPEHLRLIAEEGHPAKVLLDHSDGAVMLIVGNRGHGGLKNLLMGSVTARCVDHARCPVMVVPALPAGDNATDDEPAQRTETADAR